jgi:hypothetical protein
MNKHQRQDEGRLCGVFTAVTTTVDAFEDTLLPLLFDWPDTLGTRVDAADSGIVSRSLAFVGSIRNVSLWCVCCVFWTSPSSERM